MSNRLTNRRGRVPKPAVCLSKQKWFDQSGALVTIPAVIAGFLQILYQPTIPFVPDVNDLVLLARQGQTLEWEVVNPVGTNVLYADARFEPIDNTWTIELSAVYNVTPISQAMANRSKAGCPTINDVFRTAAFNWIATPSIIASASFGINY